MESAVGGGACFPGGGSAKATLEGGEELPRHENSLPPSLLPPSVTLPHTPAKTATSQQMTPSCIQAEHLEVALPRSLPSRRVSSSSARQPVPSDPPQTRPFLPLAAVQPRTSRRAPFRPLSRDPRPSITYSVF